MKRNYKYNRSNYKYQNPEIKKPNKILYFALIIIGLLLISGIVYYFYNSSQNSQQTEIIKTNINTNTYNEALKEDKGQYSDTVITNSNGTYLYNSTTKEIKEISDNKTGE